MGIWQIISYAEINSRTECLAPIKFNQGHSSIFNLAFERRANEQNSPLSPAQTTPEKNIYTKKKKNNNNKLG